MTIWTVGHSTRSPSDLVEVLRAHGIGVVADVRSFPQSRRYPHFNRENLERDLSRANIEYYWMGGPLGGYRKKGSEKSPHIALRSQGFRHYADHMRSQEFHHGIRQLLRLAKKKRTAYMCAERLWWRCHRSLMSDYLSEICDVEVIHIHDRKKSDRHRLQKAARMSRGQLVYDVGETKKLL